MCTSLKNWFFWKFVGKKAEYAISRRITLMMTNEPDIDHVNISFKGREFTFVRQGDGQIIQSKSKES